MLRRRSGHAPALGVRRIRRVRSRGARPRRDRVACRDRHGDLSVCPAGAADPACGRCHGAEAVSDRRRADRQLCRLHALLDLAAQHARAPERPAPESGDRAALRRRCNADRPPVRPAARAALRPTDAASRRRRRFSPRRVAGARLRALRRPGARGDHRRRGQQRRRAASDRPDPRLRGRRRDPDAADRDRRPRDRYPPARPGAAAARSPRGS